MLTRHRSTIGLAVALSALSFAMAACDGGEGDGATAPATGSMATDDAITQVYTGSLTVGQAQAACRCRLQLVRIGGTVFHFGLDLSQTPPVTFPFQSTVAGARVWIAEAPITRKLGIRSDANGNWSFLAVKLQGTPLPVSFVYEKDGFPTTKSQVFQIGDAGIADVAVQFPTAAFYAAAKGQLEQQVGALIGAPYTLNNILVTTVGKAWASMFNPDTPHGDPGASVSITPGTQFPLSLGPIYFNEAVSPDPTISNTSVDGGVLFGNLASGRYSMTASKAPFSYTTLAFVIQDDIPLYIASPPHGIQGTNTSGPGLP